jgi:PQQ-dependent dehydrogenase (methanol/ethanol family)
MSPSRRINLRNMVMAWAIVPVFTAIGQAPREAPAPVPAAVPVILQNYKNVTTERLRNPEADDWLMIRRTWDGQGYSPLDQITPSNVSSLRPAWVFSTGVNSGHESAALVNHGVMFVSTPGNQVLAIDAKTGLLLWRYRRRLPDDVVLMHPTSRGVALYGDKVYFCAGDAVLVAIDAKTGKEVWSTKTAVNKEGYYMSLAPQVADGRILIGTSGGEWGIRGFIAAFDPESGKELWRTFTVPAPGEVGSESWPKGDQWKTGGGSIWVTGNYDPETKLAYWGVGNGGPWMGDQRPGDNLYTSSTIAIDVSTGTIKGHHQYHPNDSWDWDEVSPPILVDYKRGGKTIKGLIDVARDGYLWFLERASGQINYVEGKPYVHQDVFKSLDPKTGRPNQAPARRSLTAHPYGAAKTGRLPRSARRRACSTSRRTKICARRPAGSKRNMRRAGSIWVRGRYLPRSPGRTILARCKPGTSTPANAHGLTITQSLRIGDPCWPPAAASCSAVEPTIANSTPSTPQPESCYGSSPPIRASSGNRPRF